MFMCLKRFCVSSGVACLLAASAPAQSNSSVRVKIPFEFTISSRTFPAGGYAFTYNGRSSLSMVDSQGKTVANLPIITRVSRDSKAARSARVSFDMVGGRRVLSEIWMKDEDGMLVSSSKDHHKHETVRVD